MDIVERLRDTTGIHENLMYEAANEIERLRKALQNICDGQRDADRSYAELFAEVKIEARAALKEPE